MTRLSLKAQVLYAEVAHELTHTHGSCSNIWFCNQILFMYRVLCVCMYVCVCVHVCVEKEYNARPAAIMPA